MSNFLGHSLQSKNLRGHRRLEEVEKIFVSSCLMTKQIWWYKNMQQENWCGFRQLAMRNEAEEVNRTIVSGLMWAETTYTKSKLSMYTWTFAKARRWFVITNEYSNGQYNTCKKYNNSILWGEWDSKTKWFCLLRANK